jgi:uncharacterized membrane protein
VNGAVDDALEGASNGRRSIGKEGSRKMLIGLILTSVVLAGFAQITLKTGVNHVTDAAGGGELHMNADSLRSLLSSPIVWAGLVLFGLSAIVWLFALSRASLSFALLVLHETVPALRWLGVAFIVTGIILVAQTPHR